MWRNSSNKDDITRDIVAKVTEKKLVPDQDSLITLIIDLKKEDDTNKE